MLVGIRTFKEALYIGGDILQLGGNTELFEYDVLGLDIDHVS